MTDFRTISIKPKPLATESVTFDASKGWEWTLKLAEWCGGTALRDSHQPDKAQYWVIRLPNGEHATPGSVVVAFEGGEFKVFGRREFDAKFTYRSNLGTWPCYLSPKDSRYHKKVSSYSDLTGFARCSTRSNLIPVSEYLYHTHNASPAILCPTCFGCP